ncbi:MAG TPA: ArsR family transcriptional regulator [Euryarchaeota archaeon]|nr:ArsR family transcriptional regulator [Euryarchaeota archaeon]
MRKVRRSSQAETRRLLRLLQLRHSSLPADTTRKKHGLREGSKLLDQNMRKAETYFFKALSDETRLKILELLKDQEELSVSELCNQIEKEQATVSHHLACLRNCGLVSTRREGKNVIYSLNCEDRIKTILELAEGHVRNAVEDILRCEVVR